MADVDFTDGDVRVRITGLRDTVRALEKAGADAQDMKDAMHRLGSMVVDAAAPPRVTGNLAGTIRAGRGKTKAVVRAGGRAAPYGPVIHYGWPARNITAHPFLTEALNTQRAAVLRAFDDELTALLQKADLR